MKETQFVNSEDIKTIEQYATSLLYSTISLQTLHNFQVTALREGLLDESEEELMQTICWEIKRLLSLYFKQLDSVLDRTNIDHQTIVDSLQAMTNTAKTPRNRKK